MTLNSESAPTYADDGDSVMELAPPPAATARTPSLPSPYLRRMEELTVQINRARMSWDQKLSKLSAELADERRTVERLERQLRERVRQAEDLEGRLAASETRIESMMQDLAGHARAVTARNETIASLNDEIDAMKARERDLEETMRRSDEEKDEIVRRFDVVLEALSFDGPVPADACRTVSLKDVAAPALDVAELGLDVEDFAREVGADLADLAALGSPAGTDRLATFQSNRPKSLPLHA